MEDQWVFEVWTIQMQAWLPLVIGSEVECRERLDWYLECRPDLTPQLHVRSFATDPLPPDPPIPFVGPEQGPGPSAP